MTRPTVVSTDDPFFVKAPMHLTRHTDFALRILIYLGVHRDAVIPVVNISRAFGISRNHLLKVQQKLTALGVVAVTRGRLGGLKLAKETKDISVGEVVRALEASLEVVECFNPATDTCAITPACGLKPILMTATEAFLDVLDRTTLADVIGQQRARLAELMPGTRRATT